MVDALVYVNVMTYSVFLKRPERDCKSMWDAEVFVEETSSDPPIT